MIQLYAYDVASHYSPALSSLSNPSHRMHSKKLDKKVEDAQTKASESGEKIQQMQSAMQQAAAEAARAVAQQHSQESS